MREVTYEKDKLEGEAKWWNADGLLLSTGTYRSGAPWKGTFPERADGKGAWVVRTYADGKAVGEEPLPGQWWW